jgi:regulator of protease activity HflC (stomatin/prohibitin superfamily)
MEPALIIFFLFLTAAVLVVAVKAIRIVPQAAVMIIERLGKFYKLADSGLHVLIPFIDKPRVVSWRSLDRGLTSIDMREQFLDMPLQAAITRDNVQIVVDAVVYWQITAPLMAVYEVVDLIGSITQLTVTGMRSVMGDMDLDQCLSSREEINGTLRLILDEATDKWGVKVMRVDVKNINPPEDVRLTMEKQMTAERTRRALVLQAEGEKQAAIKRAEGEKQASITRSEGEKESAILQADGSAQARLRNAAAEAEAIQRISQAMLGHGNPAQYLITKSYIESLHDMTGTNNSKIIFMPVETSSMLSNVGGMKEILSQAGEKTQLKDLDLTKIVRVHAGQDPI